MRNNTLVGLAIPRYSSALAKCTIVASCTSPVNTPATAALPPSLTDGRGAATDAGHDPTRDADGHTQPYAITHGRPRPVVTKRSALNSAEQEQR